MKKYTLSLFILFTLLNFSLAQNWEWAKQYGDTGNENINGMVYTLSGNILLGGSFENEDNIDVFLVKTDSTGEEKWSIYGGSFEDDKTAGIVSDFSENVYWTGMFWGNADFNELNIQTPMGGKGIFLVKVDKEGNIVWGKSFYGNGVKTATDIVVDNDDIYLTGYFSDTLYIIDTFLISSGERDVFLTKFNSEGQFIWAFSAGLSGKAWAKSIDINNSGEIVVGGYFNGSMIYANDTIQTNTTDNDIFILKSDTSGNSLWIQKAGGVYDDQINDLAITETGNIYATGHFSGVLKLNDEIQINTLGYDDDFFLLEYSQQGEPLMAKSFGGNSQDRAEDLKICNNSIFITGYFQDQMIIDNLSISTSGYDYGGFFAEFDISGNIDGLFPIFGDEFLKGQKIACQQDTAIFLGGSFSGSAWFNDMVYNSNGGFDIFFGKLKRNILSENEIRVNKKNIDIYPIPATENIFIKTEMENYLLKIYNPQGRLVFSGENIKCVNVNNFPVGTYFLELLDLNKQKLLEIGKCIIKR